MTVMIVLIHLYYNSGQDDCGVCYGDNADQDCNGDCFGEAVDDSCGVCSGGNSGHDADSDQDCAGDMFWRCCRLDRLTVYDLVVTSDMKLAVI